MFGKIFKIISNAVLFALVILGIFVVFSFVPFPRLFGGQAGNYKVFTVQSGSMEPAIHTGSLVFVKPMGDYDVGDIITKKTADPKVTITHRIVEKKMDDERTVFRTKGDANEDNDMEDVLRADIIGKVIFKLPFVGYPVSFARTSQGLILIIVIPAVIIIYDEMNKIKAEVKRKTEEKKKAKEEDGDIENVKKIKIV